MRHARAPSVRGLLLCVLLVAVGSLGCTDTDSSSASARAPSTATAPVADADQGVDEGSLGADKRALVAEKRAEGLEPNRLIESNSPYLLQHAFNPVDWHVWGEAAFEKARAEDKPIFLSVGYSTCYWCHVMERTVFSDEEIAGVLNERAVPVKVDREERPDVDRIYMQALQMMRGGGGWPMSMFLTPELEPFFGATYIPPEGRGEQPGFPGLVRQIHEAWTNDREQVEQRAAQMVQGLQQRLAAAFEPTPVGPEVLDQGFAAFEQQYDSAYGGFGEAPKFPRPATPRFLLHYHGLADSDRALEMTEHTLRAMARGGMYDHLGEGFHRYSTDERWHVPHFEKMLYDQALLAQVYLQAHAITGDDFYAGVARDVLAFVDREMTRPEGAFYSALNAESLPHEDAEEPEEGAYYVWTAAEIEKRLPARQARVFRTVYGVEENGNVQRDPHDVFTGKNVLYRAHTAQEAAERFDATPDEVRALLREAEATLLQARQERIEPSLDDKSVTAWNGMMISAYARAYELLGDEPYRETATRAAEFLLEHVHDDSSGRLYRRYRNGEAAHEANMEDYAYLAGGLVDLYRATGTERWLDEAIRLTDRQVELFYDEDNGGFFDTTGEDASLIVRTKEFYGGALPAGNAVALTNLVELGILTGQERYQRRAAETLEYFGTVMQRSPSGVPEMLTALTKKLEAA